MAKNVKIKLDPETEAQVENKTSDETPVGDSSTLWQILSRDVFEEACGCGPDVCEAERRERLDEILAQTSELSSAILVLSGIIQSLREEI